MLNKKLTLIGLALGALIVLGTVVTITAMQNIIPAEGPLPTATVAPQPDPEPEVEPGVEPGVEPLTIAEIESAYLIFLRDNAPSLLTVDDATLIETGRLICQSFERGQTFSWVFQTALGSGLTFEEATTLIGTAVGAFCPDQQGKLT